MGEEREFREYIVVENQYRKKIGRIWEWDDDPYVCDFIDALYKLNIVDQDSISEVYDELGYRLEA